MIVLNSKFAMKNNNNSLGNSSTKIQALSTRIDRISKEINPSGTVSSTRTNPRAIRTSRHTWINRRVRSYLYQSVADPATLTIAKIVSNLNDETGDDTTFRQFCIKKITAWNITPAASTSNYIRGRTYGAVTTNAVEIYAEDIGTASSLPGFVMEIPNALAALQKGNSSSTTVLADFVTYPLGGSIPSGTTQTLVVDCDISVLVL